MVSERCDEFFKQDQNLQARRRKLEHGSKALCKAILQTGKVYRRMTIYEQEEAKLYAGLLPNGTYLGLVK
jgi:hypothetical protein